MVSMYWFTTRSRLSRRRHPGIALLLVLFFVTVAFVLGVSYVKTAAVKMVGSSNLVKAARARTLAESALQHALYVLQTAPESVAAARESSPLGPFSLGSGSYYIYSTPGSGTNDVYTVIGRATSLGVTQTSTMTVQAPNLYDELILSCNPESYWRLGETSGTGVIDAMGRHNGWYMDGPVLNQQSPLIGAGDSCVKFDGSNDRADVGQISLAGSALTIVAWVKANQDNMNGLFILAKSGGDSGNDHIWSLGISRTGGENRLMFRVKTGAGSTDELVAGSGSVQMGQWAHVAAVYDGSNMILYQDGVEVGRAPLSGSIEPYSDIPVWVGSNPPKTDKGVWDGWIDEVAFFASVLTTEQIAALYGARRPAVEIISWDD